MVQHKSHQCDIFFLFFRNIYTFNVGPYNFFYQSLFNTVSQYKIFGLLMFSCFFKYPLQTRFKDFYIHLPDSYLPGFYRNLNSYIAVHHTVFTIFQSCKHKNIYSVGGFIDFYLVASSVLLFILLFFPSVCRYHRCQSIPKK